ncbi:xanthine dehydrogenase family protein molybdopterin-binding subunit [Amycolatopsis eburnea]|uniref:Carbon monoxide dehydrogenase n=1 Tax=Amycolatopsis eburnea TaxID=2267691 RepID=A0A3R9EL05_9PSEU|nr:xanthine dehydrogenase family protein molybdopterin-binding subunit [Amycolatopsis eburnea]RSD10228.1 carbon monoxide dehydrogenase [Amycolatopsis eburnea]
MRATTPWPRKDAFAFAGGTAGYVDDVRPPGLLHMAVVRSTRAHAGLVDVDTAATEAVPGVVRVLTGREAARHLRPMPYQFGEPELIGGRRSVLPALPVDVVRYVGEPIAVVAGETPGAARAGAAAVQVSYEDRPALLDASRFLGAGDLGAEDRRRLIAEHVIERGDVAAALAAAPYTLEQQFSVGRSTTAPLEPRGYVAEWDRAARTLLVHASHQQPFQLRAMLAEVLDLPVADVRVVVPNIGGSFGLKMSGQVEEPLVALLSMLCERPVKWIESRAECFLGGGREQVHRVRVGFDRTGRIHALRDHAVLPVGAESVSPGWRQSYVSAAVFPTAYDIEHIAVRSRVVATNEPPWHSCRGFGKEAPVFVMERIMDLVARRLGLDPAGVRRRNILTPQAMPHRMPSGYRIDSGDFGALLGQVLELAGDDPADQFEGTGIALEVTPEGGGHVSGRVVSGERQIIAAPESATVSLDERGRITVLSGVTDPGGGNTTVLARLAAEQLGTGRDRITVVQGDTALCPPGTGSASSRGVAVGGAAVVLAAGELADRLRRTAAGLTGVPAERIVLSGEAAHAGAAGSLTFDLLAKEITESGGTASVTRSYRPEPPHNPEFRYSYPYFSSGAYVARVRVDPLTGVVKLRALTAVHDCGRVLDPVLVEGQLQGAIAMGAGLALTEESRFDETGTSTTTSFKEYLVPRANDLPDFIIGHHETRAPATLLGAKGAGEAGVGGALAAIANAVDDVLHRLGAAPVTSVPLSPPVVTGLLDAGVR